MPDGFDPHVELARIYTLRDLMRECRQRLPKILEVLDSCMTDESPDIQLNAVKIGLAYGFGKPAQSVRVVMDDPAPANQRRIAILPDNNRKDKVLGPVIDA